MKNTDVNAQQSSLMAEYRSFEEFQAFSDEQILEIDQFLQSYAELVYTCFSRQQQKAKIIAMNQDQNHLKAA